MGKSFVWALGLISLIVLTLFCTQCHRPDIEQDLTRRAADGLQAAGFDGLTVSAEGRDLTLYGTRPAEVEKAMRSAKVYGVRVVRDGMQGPGIASGDGTGSSADGTAALTTGSWTLSGERGEAGSFRWQGALASASAAKLGAASARWLGDGVEIGTEQRLDDGSEATPWPAADETMVLAALPFLSTLEGASLQAEPGRYVLTGTPVSLAEAQTVQATLAPLTPPGAELELRWNRPWGADELQLEAVSRASGWRLFGLVPEGDRETWLKSMRDAGLEPFEDRLIEAGVEAPEGFGQGFGAGLSVLAAAAGDLESTRWREQGGSLELFGLSDDPAVLDRLRGQLSSNLPPGSEVRYSVERRLQNDECRQGLIASLAKEKIRFASGSAVIGPESRFLLESLAATLRRCPGNSVIVEGHTDSDGPEAFNEVLSTRRADAVYRRLVSLGVESTRLQAVGYGASRPLVAGDDPEAKRQNRRIELNIQEGN